MFDKKVKCIVCQEQIDKKTALKEYSAYFCSEKCLNDYKAELEKLNQNTNLDDCC